MGCPKCGSNNLWDDNFWWGCNDCSFMKNEESAPLVVVPIPNYHRPTYIPDEEE